MQFASIRRFSKLDDVGLLTARYLAVKLVIVTAAVLGIMLPFGAGLGERNYIYRQPNPARLVDRFSPFDGQWYLAIAQTGYHAQPRFEQQFDYNFFPLYPAAIALLAPLFGGAAPAGIVVSLLAGYVAARCLYRLVATDYPAVVAHRTVWYLLTFPTAVVLSAVYSEALFLAFAVAAMYAGRRRAWGLAAGFGAAAALTRSVGGLVVIPLVVQYTSAHGFRFSAWLRALVQYAIIPLAVAAYLGFVALLSGDWWGYPQAVAAGWEHRLAWPDVPGTDFLKRPLFGYRDAAVDVVFGALFTVLLVPIARRLQPEYTAYAAVFTLVPQFAGGTMSLSRYLLVSWPHFLWLASSPWLKRPILRWAIGGSLLGLLIGYTLRFTNWAWIG